MAKVTRIGEIANLHVLTEDERLKRIEDTILNGGYVEVIDFDPVAEPRKLTLTWSVNLDGQRE
jgi:hypothetical protein